MCRYYTDLKRDYLYRGDVLYAVPFVSIDDDPIAIQRDEAPSLFETRWQPEPDPAQNAARRMCVASTEWLSAVVLSRTCEANKPYRNRAKMYPYVIVAPIRPYEAFPQDPKHHRPFHEMVLEGFPSDREGEPPDECWRFSVLPPSCDKHGEFSGGLICFREMQPIPIHRALQAAEHKLCRLSPVSVGSMVQRLYNFFEQTERDYAEDAAPEGEPSPIVNAFHKRKRMEAERARKGVSPAETVSGEP